MLRQFFYMVNLSLFLLQLFLASEMSAWRQPLCRLQGSQLFHDDDDDDDDDYDDDEEQDNLCVDSRVASSSTSNAPAHHSKKLLRIGIFSDNYDEDLIQHEHVISFIFMERSSQCPSSPLQEALTHWQGIILA